MSSESTTSRLESLRSGGSAAFKAAGAPERETSRRDRFSSSVRSAKDLESSVKDNPFYKIATNADLSNEEKVALIRKVLTYNRGETKDQNAERLAMLKSLEKFLQDQNLGLADQLIDLNGSDIYPKIKNTMGEILDQWAIFEKEISAITGPLRTIEEIRSAGGKDEVLEALRKANDSKRLGIELNEKVSSLESEEKNLSQDRQRATAMATQLSQVQEVEKSKKFRNFFASKFGTQSHVDIVQREQDIADSNAKAAALAADLVEKRKALEEQLIHLQELDAILAADPTQKKVQDLIDIGTAAYQQRVDNLKDSAKAFITYTRENLEACVARLELSDKHIDGLDSSNESLTTYYNLIAQGNREAMGENVKLDATLKAELEQLEAGNPDDPKVQIRTMEVKRDAANVNSFVTTQQSAAQRHMSARNDLSNQQASIIALKRHNEVALQQTTINLTSGVSTAATHFATTLIAVNSAATAEASQQIGEMFKRVGESTQETLEAVLGHLVEDISSGRVQIDERSEGIRKLTGVLGNVREGLLSGIKDTLSSLDGAEDANKDLAAVMRQTRAVETDANREHGVDGAETVETFRPAQTDRFGLNLS